MKDLNVSAKTIKHLEENMGNSHSLVFGSDFLLMIPKAKIDKWNYIKMKISCALKDTGYYQQNGRKICKSYIC